MPEKSLKWYRQLADKKGRLETGLFLVEGEKAIQQIVASHPDAITEIISVEEPPSDFRNYPVRTVTASQFRYISSVQTPQGIMAVVKIPQDIYSPKLPKDIRQTYTAAGGYPGPRQRGDAYPHRRRAGI